MPNHVVRLQNWARPLFFVAGLAAAGVSWHLAQPQLLRIAVANSSFVRANSPVVYHAFARLRPELADDPYSKWRWDNDAPNPQFFWQLTPTEGRPAQAYRWAWTSVDLRGQLLTVENCQMCYWPALGPGDLAGRGECEVMVRKWTSGKGTCIAICRVGDASIAVLGAISTKDYTSVYGIRGGAGEAVQIAVIREASTRTGTSRKLALLLGWAADGTAMVLKEDLPDGWKTWIAEPTEVRRWPRDACMDQIFDAVTAPLASPAMSAPSSGPATQSSGAEAPL